MQNSGIKKMCKFINLEIVFNLINLVQKVEIVSYFNLNPLLVLVVPNWYTLAVSTMSTISATFKNREYLKSSFSLRMNRIDEYSVN